MAARFLNAGTLGERLETARQIAAALFKEIPQPARID
jgi:hypothetical protein